MTPVQASTHWRKARRAFETGITTKEYDIEATFNRFYYAAFNGVSALFAYEGLAFRKHKGVATAVHRELVNAGRWSRDLGAANDKLQDFRMTADYGEWFGKADEQLEEAQACAYAILKAVHDAYPDRFPLE